MKKIIRTCCQGCQCECGVLAHIEDGRVVKLEGDPEHPMNRGFICIRGRAQHHFVYHPDRLKYPLRRSGERGGGKWERISWEDALNGIAEKLTEIREKYGSESIATCYGTGPRMSNFSARLLAPALGTPNAISTNCYICFAPSVVASVCTVGHPILMEKGPDYLPTKCILICGANPLASHASKGKEIIEAKRKNKAKRIVIDPRRTPLAAQADLWLQIRPGTDLALALGMINTIINEELYDKEFVDKWCYGFDKLREHVKAYSLERVAKITWVPADKIKEAARIYATTKPAALHQRVAVEHNINSTQTVRALAMLVALTGNIDVKGGNLLPESIGGFVTTSFLRIDKQFRLDLEVEKKRIVNGGDLSCGREAH